MQAKFKYLYVKKNCFIKSVTSKLQGYLFNCLHWINKVDIRPQSLSKVQRKFMLHFLSLCDHGSRWGLKVARTLTSVSWKASKLMF